MSDLDGKLVFLLSMFGAAMGVLTVFVIGPNVEPIFWLLIFVVCAYLIAKKARGRLFLHGFVVSLLNSVWITSAHIAFASTYLAHHPGEVTMMAHTRMPDSPRVAMLVAGPVVGVVSGVVLGLLAHVAGKLLKTRRGK